VLRKEVVKLSERITRWRTSRDGLTKAKLARACGVSQVAVVHWEKGNATPRSQHLEKIAETIGVSMAVFWGEPPAAPPKKRARAS
jgi:transcriptional regulator with XRE-family HTH domain